MTIASVPESGLNRRRSAGHRDLLDEVHRGRVDQGHPVGRAADGDQPAVGRRRHRGQRLAHPHRTSEQWVASDRGEQAGPRLGRVVEAHRLDGQEQRPVDGGGGEGLSPDPAGVGGGGGPIGATGLADGQPTGDDRHGEEDGDRRRRARGADGWSAASSRSRSSASRRSDATSSSAWARKARSVGSEVGTGPLDPLDGAAQADAPVQLAGRATEPLPVLGRHRQVTAGAQAVDVVVDPAPQSRPRRGQRLVGELDAVPVQRHQAGGDQPLDEGGAQRTARHRGVGHADPMRCTERAGRDQAQQEVAEHRPLRLLGRLVDGFRREGDGAADAAGPPVAGHRQRPALAVLPGLAQRVREEGEAPGGALDLVVQQIDQTRLEAQPDLAGRSLDGGGEVLAAHRTEQVQAPLGDAGEATVGRQLAEVIGPDGQHQRPVGGPLGERGEERGPLVHVAAAGDRLLALVDDQAGLDAGLTAAHRRQRPHRVLAGAHDVDRAAGPGQRGGEAGPQQRRLAAARRSDDGDHAGPFEHPQAMGDVGVPSEEHVGVLDPVREQAGVGAAALVERHVGRAPERRILAEDGELQRPQVGAGLDAERLAQARGPRSSASSGRRPGGRTGTGRGRAPPSAAPGRVARRRATPPRRGRRARRRRRATTPARDPRCRVGATPAGPPRPDPTASRRGRAAPDRSRCRARPGRPRGPVVLAEVGELTGPSGEPLEPADVDLLGWDRQAVAVGHGLDGGRAERPPQAHHAALHHLGRRRRGRVAPQRFRQLDRGHDLAGPDRQRGEHDAVAGAQAGAPVIDPDRPQQRDRHGPSVGQAPRPVNGADTAPIPDRRTPARRLAGSAPESGPDDHDRAGGVGGHLVADRPEQEAAEAATTTAADDEEVGVFGHLQHGGRRRTADDAHLHVGRSTASTPAPTSAASTSSPAASRIGAGSAIVGDGDRREAPGVHDDEGGVPQPGLFGGPGEGPHGVLRAVDADDDPPPVGDGRGQAGADHRHRPAGVAEAVRSSPTRGPLRAPHRARGRPRPGGRRGLSARRDRGRNGR